MKLGNNNSLGLGIGSASFNSGSQARNVLYVPVIVCLIISCCIVAYKMLNRKFKETVVFSVLAVPVRNHNGKGKEDRSSSSTSSRCG